MKTLETYHCSIGWIIFLQAIVGAFFIYNFTTCFANVIFYFIISLSLKILNLAFTSLRLRSFFIKQRKRRYIQINLLLSWICAIFMLFEVCNQTQVKEVVLFETSVTIVEMFYTFAIVSYCQLIHNMDFYESVV